MCGLEVSYKHIRDTDSTGAIGNLWDKARMEEIAINRVQWVHSPFKPLTPFKSTCRFRANAQKTKSAPLLCFAMVHDNITELRGGGGGVGREVFSHMFQCSAIMFVSQSMSRLFQLHSHDPGPKHLPAAPERGNQSLASLNAPWCHEGSIWSKLRPDAQTPWCRKDCQWDHFIGGMEKLQGNNLTSLSRLPPCCRQAPAAWANRWPKQPKANWMKLVFSYLPSGEKPRVDGWATP